MWIHHFDSESFVHAVERTNHSKLWFHYTASAAVGSACHWWHSSMWRPNRSLCAHAVTLVSAIAFDFVLYATCVKFITFLQDFEWQRYSWQWLWETTGRKLQSAHSEVTTWNCLYHGLDCMYGSTSSVTEWFHTGIVCHNMLSTHPQWTVSSRDRTHWHAMDVKSRWASWSINNQVQVQVILTTLQSVELEELPPPTPVSGLVLDAPVLVTRTVCAKLKCRLLEGATVLITAFFR